MNVIRRCIGTNGVLELYPDHLKIIRPGGCLAFFPRHGEKMIAYSKLSAVQYKPPTYVTGFIQFVFSGTIESKRGSWNAASLDENAVVFSRKEEKAFEYARDFVQDRILHPSGPE